MLLVPMRMLKTHGNTEITLAKTQDPSWGISFMLAIKKQDHSHESKTSSFYNASNMVLIGGELSDFLSNL